MGIAVGMKELTQDIASSHEDRAKRLREMNEKVQDLIQGFQASRKEAGAQQRESLAQDSATRKSEVRQMRADFRRDREKLRTELKEASAAWQDLTSAKVKSKKQRKEV